MDANTLYPLLQLIGPTYSLLWQRLLKLLLLFVPATVGTIVAVIEAADGRAAGAIGSGISTAIEVAVQTAFWVTLVFAVLERVRPAVDLPEWTVDQLPDAPTYRDIPLADTIASGALVLLTTVYPPWQHYQSWVHDDAGTIRRIDKCTVTEAAASQNASIGSPSRPRPGTTGEWAGTILLVFRGGRLVEVGTATVPPRSPAGAAVGMSFASLEEIYGDRGEMIYNSGGAPGYLVRVGSRVELFTGHPISGEAAMTRSPGWSKTRRLPGSSLPEM